MGNRPLRDQLRSEVASLYSFVDSISRACAPAPRTSAFPESSSKFFKYIHELARCTNRHIAHFDEHYNDSEEEFDEARAELGSIRAAWRELHGFIKPSADADTLNQPTALLAALVERLRQLRGFEQSELVIFHSHTFDYMQVNPAAASEAFDQLARIVDATRFQSQIGLVGLPNSQGDRFFMNCLVAHEIGEFVYARRRVEYVLGSQISTRLAVSLSDEVKNVGVAERTQLTNTVTQWAKELFCDLLAVRLIGPSYTFAYVELFDLPNLLTRLGTAIAEESKNPPIRFYSKYPSHPFRVREQVELLNSDGWLTLLGDLDCRVTAFMRAVSNLKDESFLDSAPDPVRRKMIQVLLDSLPAIRQQVGAATDGIDVGVYEFRYVREAIEEYLMRGVVPSTLIVKSNESQDHEVHPSPVSLINSAYQFYLGRLEDLMLGIEGQDTGIAERRAFWMKRVEEWAAKALEDVALLRSVTE